ncbi:MAG: hypothetical protein ACE5GE_05820 [Phycisphaerae bacterium]
MTTAQARQLIASSRPRRRLHAFRLGAMLASGILIGVILANPAALALPSVASRIAPLVAGLTIVAVARTAQRRSQRLVERWTQAHEAVLLEDWPTADRSFSRMLANPVNDPSLRTQGLLGLAAVADHHHDYETSQILYGQVLHEHLGHYAQLQTAAIGMAASMLRTENLTGAVELIDALQRQNLPRPWKAHVELLRLFREVVMGQYDDLLEAAEDRRDLFRSCLSTRSGYGYGLMALGFHRRGHTRQAGDLWGDATLLVAPARLVDRFPQLAELAEQYPPTEVPL